MANVRFGNIDRTPETTGKSVWGWYTEPERVTEEKRRARAMVESLAAAHEVIPLRGGMASTEPAHRECKGCIQQPYCAGCMKKYKDFKIKEDGGKARTIMAPDTKRRVEEYMKEKTERENE